MDSTARTDLAPPSPDDGPPRVVAVLGHEGSGKSALVQALGGPATADLVLLEGRAALPLADAVVFVVSSSQGLDPTLPLRWEEAADAGLPRLLCVTQLDLPRADFDESVAVVQRVLGEGVHPLHLPMLDDDEQVAGVLRLLDLHVVEGGVARPADPEHVGLVEGLREDLLEALLSGSSDDALFDAWLDGEVPATEVLQAELEAGVRAGHLHPVVAVTPDGVGAQELRDLLLGAVVPGGAGVLPAVHDAAGAAVELTAAGPLAARVASAVVRVLAGVLEPGPAVVDGRPVDVVLTALDGSPLARCAAGRVCRADGLPDGLLSAADRPLTLDDPHA